jgi:hypothetical protein
MPNMFGYTSAKYGIIGLTQSFETSNPYIPTYEGIKVFSICPNGTGCSLSDQHILSPINPKYKD